MSRMVGVEWDSLAGLLNIPYSEQEEIRANHKKYPDSYSKAEQIFALFNGSQDFGRHILEKYFEELGRGDVKNEMHPVQNEVFRASQFSLLQLRLSTFRLSFQFSKFSS